MGEMYVISLFFYKSIKEFYVLSDILSKRMLFYQRRIFDNCRINTAKVLVMERQGGNYGIRINWCNR